MKQIEHITDKLVEKVVSDFQDKAYKFEKDSRYGVKLQFEYVSYCIGFYYSEVSPNVWNFCTVVSNLFTEFYTLLNRIRKSGGLDIFVDGITIDCIIDLELYKNDKSKTYFIDRLTSTLQTLTEFIESTRHRDIHFYNSVYNETIEKVLPNGNSEKSMYLIGMEGYNFGAYIRKLYFAYKSNNEHYDTILKLAYINQSEFYIKSILDNIPYPTDWIEYMHTEFKYLTSLDIALRNPELALKF